MPAPDRTAVKPARRRPAWLGIAAELLSGGTPDMRDARERVLLGMVLADARDSARGEVHGASPDGHRPAERLLARVGDGASLAEIEETLQAFDAWLDAPDFPTAASVEWSGLDPADRRRFASAVLGEATNSAFNNVADWAAVAGDLFELAILPARAAAPAAVARGRGAMRTTTRRRTSGSYYTPVEIARLAVSEAMTAARGDGDVARVAQLRVLDPAVGAGVFGMAMLDRVAKAGSDHAREWLARGGMQGVDVLPEAVAITRARLAMAVAADAPSCIVPVEAVRVGDALALGESLHAGAIGGGGDEGAKATSGFDIVVGNPPFGIRSAHRAAYFARGQASDSYGLFLALAMRLCRAGGAIALVTPDTWLSIRRHTQLREHMLANGRPRAIVLLPLSTFAARVDACVSIWSRDEAAGDYAIHDYRAGEVYGLPCVLPASRRSVPIEAVRAMPHAALPLRERGLARLMRYPADLVLRYGDVVEIKQGLATANNREYLRVARWAGNERSGGEPYDVIDPALCLSEGECAQLTADERENGLDGGHWGGRVYVPYDKGEPSVVRAGWLPMYWTPTRHYLDWSRESVARLRTMTVADRDRARGSQSDGPNGTRVAARLQNLAYYFRAGLTFSWAGAYSPTFRLHGPHPFDHGSSCVFARGGCAQSWTIEEQLAILNATPTRYLMRVYINHTVNFGIDDLKLVPMVRADRLRDCGIDVHAISCEIVSSLQAANREGATLDHATLVEHTRAIDEAVCRALGLNDSERAEIADWFRHRYPALATARDELRAAAQATTAGERE